MAGTSTDRQVSQMPVDQAPAATSETTAEATLIKRRRGAMVGAWLQKTSEG